MFSMIVPIGTIAVFLRNEANVRFFFWIKEATGAGFKALFFKFKPNDEFS